MKKPVESGGVPTGGRMKEPTGDEKRVLEAAFMHLREFLRHKQRCAIFRAVACDCGLFAADDEFTKVLSKFLEDIRAKNTLGSGL
jgi:hypothetical protein